MQCEKLNTISLPKITGIFCLTISLLIRSIYALDNLDYDIRKVIPVEIHESVNQYLMSLPKLSIERDDSIEEKSQKIVDLFIKMIPQRPKTQDILENLQGKEEFRKRIQHALEMTTPLQMLVIGFPFKSTNEEAKVIGSSIDLGEFFGLLTYDDLCREVEKAHPYGVKLTIYSDGLTYKEALGISSDVFNQYQTDLAKLACIFSSHLLIGNAQDVIDRIDQDASVSVDPQTLKDITLFMTHELSCKKHQERIIKELTQGGYQPSKRAILKETKKQSKSLALYAATTSAQFSSGVKILTNNYEGFIRLSVHPHNKIDEKCGIGPIYGSMGTPWHLTPVISRHGIHLMKKVEFLKNAKIDNKPLVENCTISGVNLAYYKYD